MSQCRQYGQNIATLASTDVDKTANTPSIKAYIDNSSEFTGYTGTVLFERTLSTAFSTNTFQRITLSTKPFNIEPCLADRAAVALVEFKASIMLIVSL
jgi:hypothetical protein